MASSYPIVPSPKSTYIYVHVDVHVHVHACTGAASRCVSDKTAFKFKKSPTFESFMIAGYYIQA